MLEKIKELRKLVPIPMSEASRLLKNNNGNVELSAHLFKADCIEKICQQTGCDKETATQYYEAEKLDVNRAISEIREDMFDQNYSLIENVTIENIKKAHKWLDMVEEKDFITSLDYAFWGDVILTLSSMPAMKEISEIIVRAKAIKDSYFENYSDNDSMDDFIRRHKLLDDNKELQAINASIPVKITLIDKELSRHLRNLYRREAQL